ncbi:MAG: hypothetical protein WDN44_00920 [Sphingomonas sp.]
MLLLLTGADVRVDPEHRSERRDDHQVRRGLDHLGHSRQRAEFSVPRYLPAWAPMYPGAEVRGKLVQRDAKGVIGRGTDLETQDPIGKVGDFYAAAIAHEGRTLVSQSRAETVATFTLAPVNRYNNSIVIRTLTAGQPPKVTVAIAVSTDPVITAG